MKNNLLLLIKLDSLFTKKAEFWDSLTSRSVTQNMADGRDNLGFKNDDESQPVKNILYKDLYGWKPPHVHVDNRAKFKLRPAITWTDSDAGPLEILKPSVEAYALLDFVRFNKMTFQAQTSQQNDEFGSQESILIDGGIKPDPPELFECSPEWCQFFLISMFWVPGLVKNYSQIDKNNLLTWFLII